MLAVLVALALGWTAAILAWPDAPIALTFDDAYYYYEIGHRLAEGQGSTFDGLHRTNGYHPLWLLVCAAVHLVLPPSEATARILLVVQVPFVFGGIAASIAALRWSRAHRADVALAAAVLGLWLAVPILIRTHLNGLESAVVVAVQGGLLALTLRHGSALHTWPAGRRWLLGGLLGLAILARTDGALLTPLILAWALPAAWRDRGARAVAGLVPVGVPPTLVLGAFLALNAWWFGTPMQVSGSLKRVPPDGWTALIAAGCLAAAAGVAWLAHRRAPEALPHVAHHLSATGWHAWFLLAITTYYTGLQTFARQWYFAPAVLWATGLVVALALDLGARARSDAPDKPPARAVLPLAGILGLPLLAGAVLTGWQLASPETVAVRLADRQAARWIDAHLPPDAVVASWDAGLIGYTARTPVVNLDGVVNDVAWLRELRAGTAGARLREEAIGWVVNHGSYEDGACTSIADALDKLGGPAPVETLQVWPYTQVGRINGGPWGRHEMATCVVRLPAGSRQVPNP